LKLLQSTKEAGYFYNCIHFSELSPLALGEKVNAALEELSYLDAPGFELVDVKYAVTSDKPEAMLYSTQIIFRSKQKIEL